MSEVYLPRTARLFMLAARVRLTHTDVSQICRVSLEDLHPHLRRSREARLLESALRTISKVRINKPERLRHHFAIDIRATLTVYPYKERLESPVPLAFPVRYHLWLAQDGETLIVWGAKRGHSLLLTRLAALSILQDPWAIHPLKIGKEEALGLLTWLTGSSHLEKGAFTGISLTGVQIGGNLYDRVGIRGPALADPVTVRKFLANAEECLWVAYRTPSLPETARPLHLRIDMEGGLVLYSPGVTQGEMDYLLPIVVKSIKKL